MYALSTERRAGHVRGTPSVPSTWSSPPKCGGDQPPVVQHLPAGGLLHHTQATRTHIHRHTHRRTHRRTRIHTHWSEHANTHTHTPHTINIQFASTCAVARSKRAAAPCAPRHGKEAVIVLGLVSRSLLTPRGKLPATAILDPKPLTLNPKPARFATCGCLRTIQGISVWHNRCRRGRNDRCGRNDNAPSFQRTSYAC